MKCLLAIVLTLSATIGMTMGQRCRVDGEWKNIDDQWSPDACTDCECQLNGDGQAETSCAMMSCMAPLCDNPIYSDDVCCPQCPPGCEGDGGWKLVGQSWNEDDCTFCICAAGINNGPTQTHCAITDCAIPDGCPNPFNVDGECCPKCCEAGSSWQPDPCTDCQCEDGGNGFSCASMSCMPPPCSNPIYSPDTCCGECPPGCVTEYGYKEIEERWAPDACSDCECVDNGNGPEQMCSMMACAAPTCENPIYSDDVCCPRCPDGCDFDGTLMPVGSSWDEDACTHCTCANVNGQTQSACAMTDCGPMHDVCNPVHVEGECCAQCCEVGAEWSPNACTFCHCEMGDTGSRAVCAIMDCMPPACDNPIYSDDQCCPQCPALCTVGDRWDEDACTSCECTEDNNGRPQETCRSMSCAVPSCEGYFTAPGDCCPQCPPICTVGERFDEDACTSCECTEDNNGRPQLGCVSMSCEEPSCEGYFTAPGDCCPQCPPICTVGDRWDEDACTSCECVEDSNGRPQKQCIAMSCMVPEGCPNPYHAEGECCPQCCEVGTTWSSNPCESCECVLDDNDGQAHAVCMIRDCAPPGCDDYYVPEGECCPKCTPICALVLCDEPACPAKNQVQLPGECCPGCDGAKPGCEVGKKRKLAGEPCTRCKCIANEDGSTQEVCKQKTCPALDCAVTVEKKGRCCPKCVCDDVICPALDCPEKYQKQKRRNCCPNCTRRWFRIQQILARGN